MTFLKTPFHERKEQVFDMIEEVMQDDYISFGIEEFMAEELMDEDRTKIRSSISMVSKADKEERMVNVSSEGSGIVDALWDGIQEHADMKENFETIQELTFKQFEAKALTEDDHEVGRIETGAPVRVTIQFSTTSHHHIVFSGKSRSITRASIKAFLELLEFLVNASKCFQRLNHLLDEARSRNRHERVEKLTKQLSDLTAIVSFSSRAT